MKWPQRMVSYGAGRSEQDQFFEAEVQYAGDAVTKEISFPAPALKVSRKEPDSTPVPADAGRRSA